MKKIICFICFVITVSACTGQLCNTLSHVNEVVVFTTLSDSGLRQDILTLPVKEHLIEAWLENSGSNYNNQYYTGELPEKMRLTKDDLKVPFLKNYKSDPDQAPAFRIRKHDGQCRAEYKCMYLRINNNKYKLEISCKPRHLFLNEKKQNEIPTVLTIKEGKNDNIIVTANYADHDDFQYYFNYKIKDHERNADKPLIHDEKTIKELIKENPNHRITDPNLRRYLDRFNLKDEIIYKLTSCNDCP